MRVVVVGAGAVGCVLTALLTDAGHSVALVARGEAVGAIRDRGIRLEGPSGTRTVRPASVGPLVPGDAELAVLAVKTYSLADAAALLAREPPRPVLLPQNGLGIEPIVGAALRHGGWSDPDAHLVRAVNSIPSTWEAPGVVRRGGRGELLLPDPREAGEAAGPVARFLELFERTDLAVRTVAGFAREVWRKAIVNAAINPITALRGVPNGALLEEPARADALRLLHEAGRAARAAGFDLADGELEADFDRVARATATNRSSMLQDLARGRPTEIDAISGAILRTAAAHGIELPATRAVIAAVEARTGRPSQPI